MDLDTESNLATGGIHFTYSDDVINITSELMVNRNYNSTSRVSNGAGSATFISIISELLISYCYCLHACMINYFIGTHDIKGATTRRTETDQIEVTTSYFEESSASGALYVLVFVTDEEKVDFTRSVLLALDRETSRDYTLPFSLSPGGYRVFVYDIEHDGTLSSGVSYPAVRSELAIDRSNQGKKKNMTIAVQFHLLYRFRLSNIFSP